MNITRDNYESFFVDFLEGNLKADQIDQFLDFINQNPDLKEEMQLFECVSLPEEQIVFSDKKQLYKSNGVQKTETENRIIAYLEGDLTSADHKLFDEEMAFYPELKKEFDLFDKTKLKADTGIMYSGKRKLYRKSRSVILMNWVARAAAVVILIWGIGSLFQPENELIQQPTNQIIAETTQKQIPPDEKLETEKIIAETIPQRKPEAIKNTQVTSSEAIQTDSSQIPEEKLAADSNPTERELNSITEITPRLVQLEGIPVENQLANSKSTVVEKIYDAPKIMTLDEFLADRAKKVSNEGLLSAQRIARAGLGVASDLTGERIGYVEKDGKISRIEFESKIFAFSIPLKKK